ncbi:hypothetical protein EVAR_60787_1 [Eumeta japonica]|uniref:Uncharacterized protein n=1 Tax=Eumeta variegata TaxID=151549 RepID=A0A4C1ZVS1_EUMVA|nr:hypothetical protein EVAR_60787_1 [Eumeta japonica]
MILQPLSLSPLPCPSDLISTQEGGKAFLTPLESGVSTGGGDHADLTSLQILTCAYRLVTIDLHLYNDRQREVVPHQGYRRCVRAVVC